MLDARLKKDYSLKILACLLRAKSLGISTTFHHLSRKVANCGDRVLEKEMRVRVKQQLDSLVVKDFVREYKPKGYRSCLYELNNIPDSCYNKINHSNRK